jgi:hypothetical protein
LPPAHGREKEVPAPEAICKQVAIIGVRAETGALDFENAVHVLPTQFANREGPGDSGILCY